MCAIPGSEASGTFSPTQEEGSVMKERMTMDNGQEQAAVAVIEESRELSINELKRQSTLIKQAISEVMEEGHHYGTIPGCGDTKTLLKPGAEKLNVLFRLAPKYEIEGRDLPNEHREYEATCNLYHIPTGQFVGQGVGVCSTMESKYRFRKAERICPECGAKAIIKGKEEYGGGWLCFKKKGGCGAKFKDTDQQITSQQAGQVENSNPTDEYNTVKKMAKKRAQVDATLTATAASDSFTQDLEDKLPQDTLQSSPDPASSSGLQSVLDRITQCKAIPEVDNVELKYIKPFNWDEQEGTVITQALAQQKTAIMKALKNADSPKNSSHEFEEATKMQAKIRTAAEKVKRLNPMFADNWLKGLCKNEGVENGAVEEIDDLKALERVYNEICKKGVELKKAESKK